MFLNSLKQMLTFSTLKKLIASTVLAGSMTNALPIGAEETVPKPQVNVPRFTTNLEKPAGGVGANNDSAKITRSATFFQVLNQKERKILERYYQYKLPERGIAEFVTVHSERRPLNNKYELLVLSLVPKPGILGESRSRGIYIMDRNTQKSVGYVIIDDYFIAEDEARRAFFKTMMQMGDEPDFFGTLSVPLLLTNAYKEAGTMKIKSMTHSSYREVYSVFTFSNKFNVLFLEAFYPLEIEMQLKPYIFERLQYNLSH